MVDNGHSSKPRFTEKDYTTGRGATSEPGAKPAAGPEAAKKVLDQVAELREYAAYLAAVKLDALKITLRKLVVYALLGIVAGIAGIVAICLAVTQALYGIADGIGLLLGGHYWAGNLITGALVLGGTALVVVLGVRKFIGGTRDATLQKYEARKAQQKAKFGRDIQQAAHSPNNN
jgi:hypothetical protein